eukprot:c6076_g1_i2.p1 GENE.c6076_g1_i2~~c6076_g1_i2.p1  ORF type:complete len:451 (-),score=98.16 c6076_g1_i2:6-1358(-)
MVDVSRLLSQVIRAYHLQVIPPHVIFGNTSSYKLFILALYVHLIIRVLNFLLFYSFGWLLYLRLSNRQISWIVVSVPVFISSLLTMVNVPLTTYRIMGGHGLHLRGLQKIILICSLIFDALSWTAVKVLLLCHLSDWQHISKLSWITAPFLFTLFFQLLNFLLNRKLSHHLRPSDTSIYQITLITATAKLDEFHSFSWFAVFGLIWAVTVVFVFVWIGFVVVHSRSIYRSFRHSLRSLLFHFGFLITSSTFVGCFVVPEFVMFVNLARRLDGNVSVRIDQIFQPILIGWGFLEIGSFFLIALIIYSIIVHWEPQVIFEALDSSQNQRETLQSFDLPEPIELLRYSSSLFRLSTTGAEVSGTENENANFREEEDGENVVGDAELCLTCCDRPRDAIFLPCGHCVNCMECSRKWVANRGAECVLCRTKIDQIVKIEKEETRTVRASQALRVV